LDEPLRACGLWALRAMVEALTERAQVLNEAHQMCDIMLRLAEPWDEQPDNPYNLITSGTYLFACRHLIALGLITQAQVYGERAVEHAKAARSYALLVEALHCAGFASSLPLNTASWIHWELPEVKRLVDIAARARGCLLLAVTLHELKGRFESREMAEVRVALDQLVGQLTRLWNDDARVRDEVDAIADLPKSRRFS